MTEPEVESEEEDKPGRITLPRVLLAGTGRGVGVSTIALGLLVAYKRLGTAVAAGKIGSSLIETTHQRRVSARLAFNFDPWIETPEQLLHALARLSGGADLALIEADRGLFDEYDDDFYLFDDARFAQALRMPVILVFDGRGYAESAAALISGFAGFRPEIRLAGVIANFIKDDRQEARIRAAVESLNGPAYLGGVRHGEGVSTGGRGTFTPTLLTRNQLLAIGGLMEQSIDVAAVAQIASCAEPLAIEKSVTDASTRVCRIAVADDAAFHLTFQDNLDLLRRHGAELVAFSPLADLKLPARVKALYLPGGYLHLYAADLRANHAMIKAISEFAAAGGVIYAEGASIAYLCRQLALANGDLFEMTGVLPGTARCLSDEPAPDQSYCEIFALERTVINRPHDVMRGFREKRWAVRLEDRVLNCFEVRDQLILREGSRGEPPVSEGLSPGPNILATALTLHWGSCPGAAQMFVESASVSPYSVPG